MNSDPGQGTPPAPSVTLERAQLAARFFEELTASVESIATIGDEHGDSTLSDLMYLQQAILTGDTIDVWPGETHIGDLLNRLPSAEIWLRHTKLAGVWATACELVPSRSAP